MDDDARWLGPLVAAVGAHPLVAYAIGLVAVLAGTAAGWRLLHRRMVPRQDSALPPGAFLLTRIAAGFAVIVGAAWAFSEIAEALGEGPALALADLRLAQALRQSVPMPALETFAAATHLADPLVLVGLAIAGALVLVLARRRGMALAWVIALAGNGVLNPTLKQVFARTRPEHSHALVSAAGYSFPSGHSSGAVVAYGMLAYVLLKTLPPRWHLAVVLPAAAVAFTVGCSRVFLGVHFASDVLAGFASGLAWLGACITSTELTMHYRRTAPRRARPEPGVT